jgi:hypothetical protein
MVEPQARKEKLVGSLALLVASAAFTIPYERMKNCHPMHKVGDDDLTKALYDLQTCPFLAAPFWAGADPGSWRFSRIMEHANNTWRWVDPDAKHPMSGDAANSIENRKAEEVLRVIRNALSHGNVVYLDAQGYEQAGNDLEYLGFLSRYEEAPDQKALAETYRLVATTQSTFLNFVRAWAVWIGKFARNTDLVEAA